MNSSKRLNSNQGNSSFIERISQLRPLSMESEFSQDSVHELNQSPAQRRERAYTEDIIHMQSDIRQVDGQNNDKSGDQLDHFQKFEDLDQSQEVISPKKKSKFKGTYTLYSLVMLGFGNTIGSGVFTLTGVASKYTGPAVFVSFIIAGMVALLTALVFAEFSAIIPKSGSSYVYTYSTFGELPAWIVGWNQNFRYGGTAAV